VRGGTIQRFVSIHERGAEAAVMWKPVLLSLNFCNWRANGTPRSHAINKLSYVKALARPKLPS
jgi:hypothetical protein